MSQLSLLPMVLPGLYDAVNAASDVEVYPELKALDALPPQREYVAVIMRKRAAPRVRQTRQALLRAAEDGFYTHVSGHLVDNAACEFWVRWCIANRHPPVECRAKQKWATVACESAAGILDEAGAAAVRDVMRRFQKRDKGGTFWVWARTAALYSVIADGVPIEQAADCARVLVDLLGENLQWPAS